MLFDLGILSNMIKYFKAVPSKSVKLKLRDTLDKVFSEYIRLRDVRMDGQFVCISCADTFSYEFADCGHYISREHMSVRFSEENCNAQCITCNRHRHGNIEGYRRGLTRKYGESVVLSLESAKYQICKMSESDYREKIAHYRKEVKRLKIEKGWINIRDSK